MVPMPFLSKHLEGESPVEMLGVSIEHFFKGIEGVCRVRISNEKSVSRMTFLTPPCSVLKSKMTQCTDRSEIAGLV